MCAGNRDKRHEDEEKTEADSDQVATSGAPRTADDDNQGHQPVSNDAENDPAAKLATIQYETAED